MLSDHAMRKPRYSDARGITAADLLALGYYLPEASSPRPLRPTAELVSEALPPQDIDSSSQDVTLQHPKTATTVSQAHAPHNGTTDDGEPSAEDSTSIAKEIKNKQKDASSKRLRETPNEDGEQGSSKVPKLDRAETSLNDSSPATMSPDRSSVSICSTN